MNRTIKITALVEDSVHVGGFKSEHGLSFHLQTEDKGILFDTGQSALVLENAPRLGADLTKLSAIVLSHGHYDHTSGVAAVVKIAPRAKVYLHPAALEPKYVRDPDNSARRIGIPIASAQILEQLDGRLALTRKPEEIAPGIFTTGEIPRITKFEEPERAFFQDHALQTPDLIPDDQALYFESNDGIVVLLGCAHAGVANTVEHIAKLTNNKPFHALLGGMHLLKANAPRIEATIQTLRRFHFKMIAPGHCTGALATAMIWNAFPGQSFQCSTGSTFSFELK
jgi:7,8-dihydropterin-6-yl-methyl-4-(beta-D-ribofuranosyl)aminobenzene 5'-phosphate synthase